MSGRTFCSNSTNLWRTEVSLKRPHSFKDHHVGLAMAGTWLCCHLFLSSSGTPINKRPVLGYRNLNLFKLYRLVHKLGGFDNVSGSVY